VPASRTSALSITPAHFFLIEDQTILRQLLRQHLQQTYPGSRITEAGTLAETHAIATPTARFTLAVVDLELPDGNALSWVEEWAKTQEQPKIIILTSASEDYVLYRAIHSNISGFVHKTDDTSMLHLAIKTVLAGGVFFSPTVQKMRTRMQTDPDFFQKLLTEKEQRILALLGQGLSNEQAGAMLGIKTLTIADHRRNIMSKLGLHNQAELMRYALEKGFSHIP
jgi:DNA-binding NarL/FixJ family response regulator